MTSVQPASSAAPAQPGSGGDLADVVETILDKGLVIDAYVRVSLVGIELLTIDARVVVASVDTYLRFAEAVNRLDIREQSNEETTNMQEITEGIGGGVKAMGAKKAAGGVIDKVGSTIKEITGGGDDDEADEDEDGDDEKQPARSRSGSGNGSSKRRSSSSSSSTRRRRSSED